jgi:hypothetical protein
MIFHGHFHTPYQNFVEFTDSYKTLVTGLGHEFYGTNGNLKIYNFYELKNISKIVDYKYIIEK